MPRPIARATLRTTGVLLLRLAIQAATLVVVARMLGPKQFGMFTGASALAVLLGGLSSFGMNLVLLREIARDPAQRAKILAYSLPTTLSVGGALVGAYLVANVLLFGTHAIPLPLIFLIGVSDILIQPLILLIATEHLGLGRIARSQLLVSLPLALRLIAAIVLSTWRPVDTLSTYLTAYFASTAVTLVLATQWMSAPWPRIANWTWPTRKELHPATGFAALSVTAAAPAELDKTLAAKLLSLENSGAYAAAARVIGAITVPVTAMLLSSLPRLFRISGQEDTAQTTRLLFWIVGTTLCYGTTIAVAMWFAAPHIEVLFGDTYSDIGTTIRWLCIAVPGITLRLALGSVLMTLGTPWKRVSFEAAGLIMLTLTAVFLATPMGINGMAYAVALTEWSMVATGMFLVVRTMRSTPQNLRGAANGDY